MNEEEVTSGMCLGNFLQTDPSCSFCLIKMQCKTQTKNAEKFGEDVIHTNQLQAFTGPDIDPMELFITKMTDALGAPEMIQKKTSSGRTMVAYIFNQEDAPVVSLVHIEGSREVRLKVVGHGDKDMPAKSTADDYLAEAEIILNHLIK